MGRGGGGSDGKGMVGNWATRTGKGKKSGNGRDRNGKQWPGRKGYKGEREREVGA